MKTTDCIIRSSERKIKDMKVKIMLFLFFHPVPVRQFYKGQRKSVIDMRWVIEINC